MRQRKEEAAQGRGKENGGKWQRVSGGGWSATGGWGPRVGILDELGQAEVRSSIRASQPDQAEEAFSHELGRAEEAKPGYQTPKKIVGWVEGRFSGKDRATKHALRVVH